MEMKLYQLTTNIVAEFVANNTVPPDSVPEVIQAVYGALADIGKAPAQVVPEEKPTPAVPIKKSVTPDHIVCLECGKKGKMLRRHLEISHGLSAEDYRARWGLPADYPFTAPNYSAQRAVLARDIGLGTTHRPQR